MDSLSSSPPPFKNKRAHHPWSNRHEDLKRAALSSLDRDLHQWKHGHVAAKKELNGDGCEGSMNFSRLDKARSFAKKDAGARYGAKPGNLARLNTERSENLRDCTSKHFGTPRERGALERGDMQRSSVQKCHGSTKQDPAVKELSGSEEDASFGKSSYARKTGSIATCLSASLGIKRPHSKHTVPCDNDASTAPCRSSSLGTEKPHFKHTVPFDNDASVVPCRSPSLVAEKPRLQHTVPCNNEASLNPGRSSTGKECLVNKDCKRIIKLKPRHTSVMETSEASKDFDLGSRREVKRSVCSPKSINGSSDELSWKSCSSVKGRKDWKLSPASSEQISDKKVVETPVTFLHVARRARSERRRDDSKSQSSKGVSLDGFGAELEEALLMKQEAEVDSGVQMEAGMQKLMVDSAAVKPLGSTDAAVSAQLDGKESQSQKSFSLDVTNEREEGEFEPDDDAVEKQPLEGGNDAEEDVGDEMQMESKVHKCDDTANPGGCREALDFYEMHTDVSKHNSIPSADGLKDALEGLKSQDNCVSDTKKNSAFKNREDRGHEINTNCEVNVESIHGGKKGNGDVCLHRLFNAMEMDLANPLHTASEMNAQQSVSASNVKSCEPPEQFILSLNMQPAGTFLEGSKDDVPVESGVRKDLSSCVEDLNERSDHDHKRKKLKVESLLLSLALPGSPTAPAVSPPHSLAGPVEPERSLTHVLRRTQSLSQFRTETISDGFTTSLCLSSFVHNPSCSLNCTAPEEQELSCSGSRLNFQGRWANSGGNDKGLDDVNISVTSLSKDRPKRKADAPLFQQVFHNGRPHDHAACSTHTGGNRSSGSNPAVQRYHQIASGSGAETSENGGLMLKDRVQKLISQAQQQPHESSGELRSLANKFSTERSKEIIGEVNCLSTKKIGLLGICSEPVAEMAQKLQELPDSFLEGLKGLVIELLGSFVKRDDFLALQQIIQRRMDLTEETLLRAHPTQLEIFVALKTGMQSFVQQGAKQLTYKALIEIFLQKRCRNVDCQQSLPVDGCECKVCSKKKGFCHECMCMVCSKFDSDSNTTRWVGCDLCMHWCHTDCGLRMSHIKSTRVAQGGAGSSEMQFQCLSCDHYMELYGFVQGVFQNFAGTWGAETLAKELDCVRRLFHGSEDARGKQLRWKAESMLQMLENNVPVHEVLSSMLHYFNEGDAKLDKAGSVSPKKVPLRQPNEVLNQTQDNAKGFATMGSIVARKLTNLVEVFADKELEGRTMEVADAQEGAREGGAKDLHSIIGLKLTDVLMYQARADAAREDATNLQHIISSKVRRMEEEFSLGCARLRLDEAEGRRRRQLEELQALERSQHDYEIMKIRIESDMKHLMMKMSKPQLA
eukprot:c3931_g1_i1 orf=155-4213(+)